MSIKRFRASVASVLTASLVVLSFSAALSFGIPRIVEAAAGDIVKGTTSSAVYVVLSDGQSLCRLTSEGHYDMWAMYKSKGTTRWKYVITVDTATYTDKGVCGLRVGSLVRTQSNPEVFVVQGEQEAAATLAQKIKEDFAIQAEVPEAQKQINL